MGGSVKTYLKRGNAAQIYELKVAIHNTKQQDLFVTACHNTLKVLSQELDLHQLFIMVLTEDVATLAEIMQRYQVFEFLAGLKPELDEVRSKVLGKEPIPCLSAVYSYVHAEESKRSVMMGPISQETSALKVIQENNTVPPMNHSKQRQRKPGEKETRWCDYCHKARHTQETYWKLNGKTQLRDKVNKQLDKKVCRGALLKNPEPEPLPEKNPFTKDQMELLYKMFRNSMNSINSSNSSSFFAQSGNTFSALNISKYLVSKPSIIDSRACNHMKNDSNSFHLYDHGSNSGKVNIANGSFVPIIGKGFVSISSLLTLDWEWKTYIKLSSVFVLID